MDSTVADLDQDSGVYRCTLAIRNTARAVRLSQADIVLSLTGTKNASISSSLTGERSSVRGLRLSKVSFPLVRSPDAPAKDLFHMLNATWMTRSAPWRLPGLATGPAQPFLW